MLKPPSLLSLTVKVCHQDGMYFIPAFRVNARRNDESDCRLIRYIHIFVDDGEAVAECIDLEDPRINGVYLEQGGNTIQAWGARRKIADPGDAPAPVP